MREKFMGNLLFSPSGRINGSDFMRGVVVLIAISAVLNILPLISMKLAMLGILGIVLLWCWIVLFIKRFHDAGKSGWMCIIPIIAFVVASVVVSTLVQSMFAGDMKQAMTELSTSGAGLSEVLEATSAMAKKTALPSAIAGAVVSYAIAFITNSMLKSDPDENQFGPAT
jgi:uncharacterized membrane protein YhaH (DUF805 family)